MQTTATAGGPATTSTGERPTVPLPDLVCSFVELMAQHPETLVAAVGTDGIMVPMPGCVPLVRHRVAVSRSVIDMVVGPDKVTVISAWERSRRTGGANAIVHLLTNPEQPVALTIVDATAVYGVHLAMFIATAGPTSQIGQGSALKIAPRTARVRKTELAIIQEIDAATTLILGWHPDEIVGRRSLDFIHPDDQERSISNWMEMLTSPGLAQRVRLRHLAADGTWVWMEITNHNLLNEKEECVLAEMLDISEELAAQEALRASEHRLRRLAESLPLGVVQIGNDRQITYANARLAEITGLPACATIREQFAFITEASRPAFEAALEAVLGGNGEDQDLHIDFDGGAEVRHCTMSMRSLTNDAGVITGAIVCVTDVSEQVRMTAELHHRATFDALTGCLNRLSIMNRLDECLAAARPGADHGVAIVFVDLNDFKSINDERGHAAGDAVLTGVGSLLRRAVREGDIVGRVGGDEFLVVCPRVVDVDEARGLAARIDAIMADGIEVDGTTLVVTVSLGVAHTHESCMSSDRLVAEADAEMYIDKRHRKDRV